MGDQFPSYDRLVKISLAYTPTATRPRVKLSGVAAAGSPRDTFSASCGCEQIAPKPSPPPPHSTELDSALKELKDFPNREYYNAEKDSRAKETYYKDVNWSADPETLFRQLSEKTQRSHTTTMDYRPSKYLYPWIDLQPDGQLKSIYSGHTMAADKAIIEDWRIGLNERTAMNALAFTRAALSPEAAASAFAISEGLDALNCEPVGPQSWFGKSQPARGDLHHLFACESRCNSRRSNLPYDEIPEGRDDWRDDCGKIAGQSDGRRFEPVGGKGAAARATLYFLLRYPGVVDDYDARDIKTLLKWHDEFPVSLYEKHRNAAIEETQGNRNPLIDFPEKARQIDFAAGLK